MGCDTTTGILRRYVLLQELVCLQVRHSVIAVILYTNKHLKKVDSIVEDEEDEEDKPQTTTIRLDNWVNPVDRKLDSNSKSE